MPLTGESKRLYQREYMRWRRSADAPRECQACGRKGFIQAHHQDYSKPVEVLWLCASCHKKLHLISVGKQRMTSNPYKSPLDKIAAKEAQPKPPLYNPATHGPGDKVLVRPRYGKSKALIEMVIPELDADGNPIPE